MSSPSTRRSGTGAAAEIPGSELTTAALRTRFRTPPVGEEDIERRLGEAGLERHAAALLGLSRPSVGLRTSAVPDADLPTGTSKLGGDPDLPVGAGWPHLDGVPMSFVGQLDCAALRASSDAAGVLPPDGLLSFFYDAEQTAWGYDPADRGACRVLHVPAHEPLVRVAPPMDLPRENRFAAAAVEPEEEHTVAPPMSTAVASLGLTAAELAAYAAVPGAEADTPRHRLLGHPDALHGDMQLECELVGHGIACGDAAVFEDPAVDRYRPAARDWRLLLQVDTDETLGTLWGDSGRIYFWMHRDALAAGRWDDVWLVLQSR